MKKMICTLLTGLMAQLSFAHSIWIQTAPQGSVGKTQEIQVYFGEYADKELSPTREWFSDLKEFRIVAIAPDGKEQQLSKTISTDHYKVQFTPAMEGVYTIALQHAVKDLYNGTRIVYYSNASVAVGNTAKGRAVSAAQNKLSLSSADAAKAMKNQKLQVVAHMDGKPAAKQEVKVFAPNGWSKTLYSNDEGIVSFTPIWAGLYQVELSHTDNTAREEEGQEVKKTWSGATYMLQVH